MAFLATDHDEASAIEALAQDSDRAAAIVACSLLEARLKRTILSHLHKNTEITDKLFDVSGAIGYFGTQLNLGFLLGIYAEPFRRELDTIRKIRNDFAHKVTATSFQKDRIRDLSKSLKILQDYLLERREDGFTGTVFTRTGYGPRRITIYCDSRDRALNDPRERYIMSCQVLAHLLASLHEAPIPLRIATL